MVPDPRQDPRKGRGVSLMPTDVIDPTGSWSVRLGVRCQGAANIIEGLLLRPKRGSPLIHSLRKLVSAVSTSDREWTSAA